LVAPKARLVHWVFDLYPEAVVADGLGRRAEALVWSARAAMKLAYRCADDIVDIGPCMGERIASYGASATQRTLPPWALVPPEPEPGPVDARVRSELFGDARLGLLYSGTLGRAHDFVRLLAVARRARELAGNEVAFAFACAGHRVTELRAALGPADTNVRLLPMCGEAELGARLRAADLHLLSLRDEWSGIVVPSKFFGSLAIGRPVVYSGPGASDIARWTKELGVGLVLASDAEVEEIARTLVALRSDDATLGRWRRAATEAYTQRFAREVAAERWSALLEGRDVSPGAGSARA